MYLNNTLFRTAQLWPDAIAVDTTERRATWAETLARVRRLAGALTDLTPLTGDRIALLGLNSAEYLELTLAVPLTPAALVTLNYRLTIDEQRHTLKECPCRVVCFDESSIEMADALRDATDATFVYWGRADRRPGYALSYDELVATGAAIEPAPRAPGDTWAVIQSGGTTGRPKAVELSFGAMAFNVASTLASLDLGERPRGLHVTPLFHLAGFAASYALTGNGGTHAFLPVFSIDGLLEGLARHRCTMTSLVPTMISWLVARDDLHRFDLSQLRNLLYGASGISLPTLRKLLALFPDLRLTQFYGQTEAAGAVASLLAAEHSLEDRLSHRLRSAGRPLPGVHLEILGADGVSVPRGETGEICARTDALFTRYIGHEATTSETKRDGWLHTGDLGHLDEDGFLYVTDRLKDMIVTGGENVSASEVENVIAQHPGVIQVAVVAAPDTEWGERVHAFVVVAETSPAVGPEALDARCRGALARYKIPRGFTIQHTPLPQTGAGKIRKDELRALLRAS